MNSSTNEKTRSVEEKNRSVRRIKTGIILFLGVGIILSFLFSAILCVNLLSLSRQVKSLEQEMKLLRNEQEKQLEADVTTDIVKSDGESSGESEKDSLDDTDMIRKDRDAIYTTGDEDADIKQIEADPELKKVYLTFDDGPSANTEEILRILRENDVRATFFVTGKTDQKSLEYYRKIVNEGHTIAMHSYSHVYGEIYSTVEAFSEDYEKIHQAIYDATGVDCKIYRFPGGSSNKTSKNGMGAFIRFLNEKGVKYFDWNVSSGDATSKMLSKEEIIENVMRDVLKYNTSVVLMHDSASKRSTVEALPELIKLLKEEGAVMLPISENTKLVHHIKSDKI